MPFSPARHRLLHDPDWLAISAAVFAIVLSAWLALSAFMLFLWQLVVIVAYAP